MLKFNSRIQALALGFAVLASSGMSIAFAQNDPSSPAGPKQEHAWGKHDGKQGGHHKGCGAMKQLGLTDEQKTRMQQAHKAFREQNAAAIESIKSKYQQLRQLGKDSANEAQRKQLLSELKQEKQALKAKREASMKGILTPEQEKRWEALKQECKAKYQAKRAERKHAGNPSKP